MIHLDLFSGIGGFAYAADQVWDNVDHIFCEFDPESRLPDGQQFCQLILKKHWPEAVIHGDIRTIKEALTAEWATTYALGNKHRPERRPIPKAKKVSGVHKSEVDTRRSGGAYTFSGCVRKAMEAVDKLSAPPKQEVDKKGKKL